MYTVEQIIGRIGESWVNIPDENDQWDIDQLVEKDEVFINVTHSTTSGEVQIDLDEIPDLYLNLNMRLDNYLATFANPTITEVAAENTRSLVRPKSIKYYDIWDFGFDVHRALAAPIGLERTHLHLPDLRIDKGRTPQATPVSYLNSVIFLVNGRMIVPEVIDDLVYLPDGYNIMQITPETQQVGVIDYSEVGGFTQEVITEDMIVDTIYQDDYKTTLRVKIDLENPSEFTTYLAINGRLYLSNFRVLDDEHYSITVEHKHAIAQALLPAELTNWVEPAGAPGTYLIASVDAAKYITQGNSFFIHVPQRSLGVLKEDLHRTDVPGFYEHYRVPQGILVLEDGSIGHYKVNGVEREACSIMTTQPLWDELLIETAPGILAVATANQESTTPEQQQGRAIMYDIYSVS